MNIILQISNKIISLILFVVIIYLGIFTCSAYYDYNKNVEQYNYLLSKKARFLSDDEICNVFDCFAIEADFRLDYYDKGFKVFNVIINSNKIHLIDSLYYDISVNSLAYKINSDKYVHLDFSDLQNRQITIVFRTLPLLIIVFIYVIGSSIRRERQEILISNAGSEALLANKTMINIAENIHHELDTPLEVIDNKIEKIHRIILDVRSDMRCVSEQGMSLEDRKLKVNTLTKLEEDFNFIKDSSEQIYNVLEKMKGFKHLRYSNGNKTLDDIIRGGFKIISLSNTNFTYDIGEDLKNYKLNSSLIKNADLLNITLNHIKNSLEANASKIYILKTDSNDKFIKIRIIDNGKGIPKEAQKNIFKANFSTKSSVEGIRGNGMYLNKHILSSAGGDIKLISTSNKGTTIELSIPISTETN